jgi:Zn-finger nucleic acid-binding protein
MDCPKCDAQMETIAFRGVEIDRCTACGGIWLDAVEPEQLRAMAGAESIDTGSPARGAIMNDKEEVDCPRCGKALLRRIGPGGLVLDSCPRCQGTYFDAGEFRRFKSMSVDEVLRALRTAH